MTFALVANREKTTDAVKLAAVLENFELPDDVKLQPNKVYYRKGDHQLITSSFAGEAQSKGKDVPEDLYRLDEVIPGDKTAPAVSETGCTIQWPSSRGARCFLDPGAAPPGSNGLFSSGDL